MQAACATIEKPSLLSRPDTVAEHVAAGRTTITDAKSQPTKSTYVSALPFAKYRCNMATT